MSDIYKDLRSADVRGVAPPQNWTTRAADEIERLRGLLREAREWHIPLNSINDRRNLAARIDAALAGTADQPAAARLEMHLANCAVYSVSPFRMERPACDCGLNETADNAAGTAYQPSPLQVTCARCGIAGTSETFYVEEGDEWECPACWERCEAQERATDNQSEERK